VPPDATYTDLMAKKISQESDSAAPASFEEAMAELEQLVAQMEAGELPLEASVTAYKRGAELVRFCSVQLEHVDQQVRMLEGDVLKPFAAANVAESGE
jgi:exodeoxyribonuclease VII small subunit